MAGCMGKLCLTTHNSLNTALLTVLRCKRYNTKVVYGYTDGVMVLVGTHECVINHLDMCAT